jgi:5-oxoprolinase (ATP-hydrolysing)
MRGVRAILEEHGAQLAATEVEVIKVGTTVATNALLERKGAPTVLAITAGHADALLIGTQARPRLFDLAIVRPAMLYASVVEVPERIAADGEILQALDEDVTEQRLAAAHAAGYRSLAIALMHGYRFTVHEARVAAIAERIGFTQISVSHRVSPLIKLVGRADTTVADAYLSPGLRRYLRGLEQEMQATPLLVMQSNGGLAAASRIHGKDAVLSGPAGGVIGAAEAARAAGFARIIGFDMGGTSTDVSHVAGDYERSFDTMVAGVRLRTPMLQVHTVAAGGGSLLIYDGHRFRVGPESAGANPGPACYGRGGPLTVTDANLLLGRIQPAWFPAVFGPSGTAALDRQSVVAGFDKLAKEVAAATGTRRSAEELAEGFLAIAVDNMARAIRKITVERGRDARDYTLVCFGGAGGQHACRVAAALGLGRIMIHPLAGVLSAYGIGLAPLRTIRERSLDVEIDHADTIAGAVDALTASAREDLLAQGVARSEIGVMAHLHLRYAGTDSTLPVVFAGATAMSEAFTRAHETQFGFIMAGRAIVCAAAEVEASAAGVKTMNVPPRRGQPAAPAGTVTMGCDGPPRQAPVFRRGDLVEGQHLHGPALIAEETATTVVDLGWEAIVDGSSNLILSRMDSAPVTPRLSTAADPLRVELFNNLFMSIAEQMGAVLQQTAQSVNIKERLDFSCAVFDGNGNLIANAPHMPVHLGSMGDSVRAIRSRQSDMRTGDSFVLNNPYAGGTHLPDITVVTPVFLDGESAPAFFVASRGHHADVGGITPGSMPPGSRTLDEEGVLLDGMVLVRGGTFQEATIRAAFTSGAFPARSVEQNLADLRAQVAANAKGVGELRRVAAEFGRDVVAAYMDHVQDHAEEAVRRVIGRLSSGSFRCPMDDGGAISVRITVDRAARSATVDFTGTSPQSSGNFNAPPSICRAAVMYVFRTLVADDIPMNEGCLRPITLVIPEGTLLNPRAVPPLPAVVAGNVETSQIVCDALYGALGVLAASQGTMNNFTFGNARHQYYETVAGGAGAGAEFDGADAVQTHMTNSRLTDPEVLEQRYPVVVERFEVRRGSGGQGRQRGGDGIIRAVRFREPMTAAILSGRRSTQPFGLEGGADGASGKTVVERADGTRQTLAATEQVEVAAGDTIVIATPGGGGFGKAK